MRRDNAPILRNNPFSSSKTRNEADDVPARTILSDKEKEFCELFCCDDPSFAGNKIACYKAVFLEGSDTKASIKANELLASPAVNNKINDLMSRSLEDNMFLKQRVLKSLLSVMDETRTANFSDKYGIRLSPAPLRAVSVNAARTIADICGWRGGDGANINIGEESNVTFNVIVPTPKK